MKIAASPQISRWLLSSIRIHRIGLLRQGNQWFQDYSRFFPIALGQTRYYIIHCPDSNADALVASPTCSMPSK